MIDKPHALHFKVMRYDEKHGEALLPYYRVLLHNTGDVIGRALTKEEVGEVITNALKHIEENEPPF